VCIHDPGDRTGMAAQNIRPHFAKGATENGIELLNCGLIENRNLKMRRSLKLNPCRGESYCFNIKYAHIASSELE